MEIKKLVFVFKECPVWEGSSLKGVNIMVHMLET